MSVVANRSKSDFSTVICVADSKEVYNIEILSNTATIRGVNSIELTHRITRRCRAELQKVKQILTTKNSIEFTYGDFPCQLKENRDNLALISRVWKRKKGERLTISANSFTKINQLHRFRPLGRS